MPRPAGAAGAVYDKAFQAKMARVLYQDPAFCTTVGLSLEAKLFSSPATRWVVDVLVSHAKEHGCGASLDAIKIRRQRDARLKKLAKEDVAEVDTLVKLLKRPVKDRSFVKGELFRFTKNQVVTDAILKCVEVHLQKGDFDAIDRELGRVLDVNAAAEGGFGHFYVADVEKRTRRRKEYTKDGVPTGLKLDDHVRRGGLWPRALGCVIAGSGRGKSHALVHLGQAAVIEGGKRVLHVTLELDEESITDRYDARLADFGLNQLEEEADAVQEHVEDLGRKHGEFLVVKAWPSVTLTVPMLRAYIRQLESRSFYPDVLIIDYADEMLPSISKDNAYEDRGNVYRELRRLAYELNVPIWTASQTNRDGLDREIVDSKFIADSFQKVMVSDLVLALCQTAKEKKAGVGRVWVDKNRGGPDKFDFPVVMDWSRSLIKDRR